MAWSSSGVGEKQLYSEHILNEELTELSNRLNLEDERKKGIKNDSRILAREALRLELPLNEMGKALEGPVRRK